MDFCVKLIFGRPGVKISYMKNPYLTKPEYEDFRKKTVDFIEKEMTPFSLEWEKNKIFPEHLLKKFVDQGLVGLSLPKEKGGLGKDFWHEVIFTESLAKSHTFGYSAVIAVHSNMTIPLLADLASLYQEDNFLKPALDGEGLLAFAVTEETAGSDVAATSARADLDGDNYIINGHKKYIGLGSKADNLLVFCKTNNNDNILSFSFIIVPAKTAGVTQKRLDTIGLNAGDLGEIIFDNVKVPQKNLLGRQGLGYKYCMSAVQRERLIASVGIIALGFEVLDKTIDFLSHRQRFGEALTKKQTVRHRLVRHRARLESLRQFSYNICHLYGQGQNVDSEIMMLKFTVADDIQNIIKDCVQLHGAQSLLVSDWLSHIHRDSQTFGFFGGASEILQDLLALNMKL